MSSLNQTKQLEQFILKTVQKQNNKEAFNDTVYTGTIEGSEAGYYNVKLTNGNSINIVKGFPLNDQQNFNIEDYVYLLSAPIKIGDNNGTKYFIIGLVEDYQEDFFNLSDLERFTILEGGSYNIPSNFLIENNTTLFEGIQESGAFKISGKFSCNADSGFYNYIFKFILEGEDNPYIEYKFGSQDFAGSPLKIEKFFQEKVFYFKENKKIVKIEIKIEKSNNITNLEVEDFVIAAGTVVDNNEKFSIRIKAQNNKNYFYSTEEEDSLILVAEAYYNNQLLSNSNIQYYWVVNGEDLIDNNYKNDKRKLHFIEEENWYCINNYIDEQVLGKEEPIQVWETRGSNVQNLKIEKGKVFISYENRIKCYIKYNNVILKSEEFVIFDFSKEAFEVSITAEPTSALLLIPEDNIVLTATVNNKNTNDKNLYSYNYFWYENNILIEDKNESTLILTNNDIENGKTATFFCEVEVQLEGNNISTEKSNEISVSSKISSVDLKNIIKYKYYISKNENVLFTKKIDEEEPVDWEIIDEDKSNIFWTEDNSINSLNDLNGIPLNPGDYLYYTSQENWIENESPLREEDWISPVLLRGKSPNGEDYTESQINTINTFNSLTGGGQTQGIFLNEEDKKAYINADFIKTENLSAISADMGEITAGIIHSDNWTEYTEDDYIYIPQFKTIKYNINKDDLKYFPRNDKGYQASTNIDYDLTESQNIVNIFESRKLSEIPIELIYYVPFSGSSAPMESNYNSPNETTNRGSIKLFLSFNQDFTNFIYTFKYYQGGTWNEFTPGTGEDKEISSDLDFTSISIKFLDDREINLNIEYIDKNEKVLQKDNGATLDFRINDYPLLVFPGITLSVDKGLTLTSGNISIFNNIKDKNYHNIYFGTDYDGIYVSKIDNNKNIISGIQLLGNGLKYYGEEKTGLIIDFTKPKLVGTWTIDDLKFESDPRTLKQILNGLLSDGNKIE